MPTRHLEEVISTDTWQTDADVLAIVVTLIFEVLCKGALHGEANTTQVG